MQSKLPTFFDKVLGSISRFLDRPKKSIDRIVGHDAELRVWDQDYYRLFITHKSEDRVAVSTLKEKLQLYGISAFVAHEDIHPTLEWQNEIEYALGTMEALVAYMTPNFHESSWTDQELGFAFGRGVPIIALRLGKDPYGFIGKFQALSCDPSQAPLEIATLLIRTGSMLNSYILAVERCHSFDHGNMLSKLLPHIRELDAKQVDRMITAYNNNHELQGSFGFNGTKASFYGRGLASHLARITGMSEDEFDLR